VQANGQNSPYKNWFADLRFDQLSPYGDPFSYAAWNGHFDLVKLNLAEPAARQHLFDAIRMWKEEFDRQVSSRHSCLYNHILIEHDKPTYELPNPLIGGGIKGGGSCPLNPQRILNKIIRFFAKEAQND
jgi:hypothetical protein